MFSIASRRYSMMTPRMAQFLDGVSACVQSPMNVGPRVLDAAATCGLQSNIACSRQGKPETLELGVSP